MTRGTGGPRPPLPPEVFRSSRARAERNALYRHFAESPRGRRARAGFRLWRGAAAIAAPFLIAALFYLSCSMAGCIGVFIPFAALPFLQVLRRRRAYLEPISRDPRFPLRISDAFSDHETSAPFAVDLWLAPVDRRDILEAIAFEALDDNDSGQWWIKLAGILLAILVFSTAAVSGGVLALMSETFGGPRYWVSLGVILVTICSLCFIAESTMLFASWSRLGSCRDALQLRIDFWWGSPVVLPTVLRLLKRFSSAALLAVAFAVSAWVAGSAIALLLMAGDLLFGYTYGPELNDAAVNLGIAAGISFWTYLAHRHRRELEADLPGIVEHLSEIGALALEHHLRTAVFGDSK